MVLRDIVKLSVLLLAIISLSSCHVAYFKTLEAFGYPKRKLLVSRVEDARDEQKEAQQQFKTALERFKSVVQFDGGQLERRYESLKSELERSEAKAAAVHNRIRSVEEVAAALFDEWEDELKQYSDRSLRRISEDKLRQTKERSKRLISIMKRAEERIDPVLKPLRDQVLFLKHNLNAKAIASLNDEIAPLQADVSALIAEMERSVAEADTFIREMRSSNPEI